MKVARKRANNPALEMPSMAEIDPFNLITPPVINPGSAALIEPIPSNPNLPRPNQRSKSSDQALTVCQRRAHTESMAEFIQRQQQNEHHYKQYQSQPQMPGHYHGPGMSLPPLQHENVRRLKRRPHPLSMPPGGERGSGNESDEQLRFHHDPYTNGRNSVNEFPIPRSDHVSLSMIRDEGDSDRERANDRYYNPNFARMPAPYDSYPQPPRSSRSMRHPRAHSEQSIRMDRCYNGEHGEGDAPMPVGEVRYRSSSSHPHRRLPVPAMHMQSHPSEWWCNHSFLQWLGPLTPIHTSSHCYVVTISSLPFQTHCHNCKTNN